MIYKIIFMFMALTLISCGKTPLYGPLESSVPDTNTDNDSIEAALARHEFVWKDGRHHFAFQWHSIPAIGTNSRFSLKFWDSYQVNFLGPYNLLKQHVCVFLWMTMPDGSEHGSSPVLLSKKDDNSGKYYVGDEVYFIMPGDWEVRVRTIENQNQCKGLKSDAYLEEYIVKISIK